MVAYPVSQTLLQCQAAKKSPSLSSRSQQSFFELPDLTYITSDFNEFVTFFVDQQFTLWPGFCVLNFLSFPQQTYLSSEKQIQKKLKNFEKFQFLKGKIEQSNNFDKSSSAKWVFF